LLYPEYPFIVELNIPSHSAAILITATKDIAEQKKASLTFRIRYACRDSDAKQHWSHNGTFCALARRYVIAGPQKGVDHVPPHKPACPIGQRHLSGKTFPRLASE